MSAATTRKAAKSATAHAARRSGRFAGEDSVPSVFESAEIKGVSKRTRKLTPAGIVENVVALSGQFAHPISEDAVRDACTALFAVVRNALLRGYGVALPGVGSIVVYRRPPIRRRDLHTGEVYQSPPRYRTRFVVSSKLRTTLKELG